VPLPGEIGIGTWGCALDPVAGAAGELLGGGRGALNDRSDLVEGHGEQVVQHERDPFGGSQPVEDHQQRQADRVGQQRLLLGVALALWPFTIGPGCCESRGSSRRDVRERSMSRHTRPTTLVSQPARFSTLLVSERLSRSQASCTASSASLSEPSIR
jgi:hypothetical protein